MRRATLFAAIVLIACGGESTSPNINVQGTYVGTYTATVEPGVVVQGVIHLTQNDKAISGTLTTTAGRTATVTGTIGGSKITATFTFTDGCVGSSTSTADVLNNGARLEGSFSTIDCLGQYTGNYGLNRQ